MAWWDAKSSRKLNDRGGTSLLRLSKPKKDLALGDAFPKLDIIRPLSMPSDLTHAAMDHERIILSPISEEHFSPPAVPPLTVHVNIQFTDPVIRSRYSRSYSTSRSFEPTDRICNGLLRRIEHCSEELLTRKDSTALDQYKDGTYERKSMRFEITFRIVRRGVGEWAERTFRSYQKLPLTVGLTKEIILATHRMVGLFFRRHDKDFQWLDGSVIDHSSDAPETFLPAPDGPLSLMCVPRSRFIESSQSFEFVPGYTIQLSFRSRNPRRDVPVFKRTLKLSSNQPAPLSLLMSEDILWKGLQAINRGLELKKLEFDAHVQTCRATDCLHSDDNALEIDLSISNNLGPLYRVCRDIKSNLFLFQDPGGQGCADFLRSTETSLIEARNDTDSRVNNLDDFEFTIVELRGARWSLRQPTRFTLSPSASYGRRTIQAALDRIQTGIGDVLRGHNAAVHISAHKRGHQILDKAIIAREKRGRPAEIFPSAEEQQNAFVTRLKTRIQRDIDMVFKDTCSIDDIAEDDHDVQQSLPLGPEAGYLEQRGGSIRSASPTKSPRKSIKQYPDSLQGSPTKPTVQRSFSLGHRSISSAASVISAKNLDDFRSADMISESGSRRSSLCAQDYDLATPLEGRLLFGDSTVPIPGSPTKSQRRFSLVPRNPSSTRVSSASTLICENLSLLEESEEVNVGQDKSTEGETVQAELSDTARPLENDGIPSNDRVDSMTLSEVADNSAKESAGVAPELVSESLARDLTSKLIAHPEVIAQDKGGLVQEETQCTAELHAAGEPEATSRPKMEAFEDAQEYSAGLTVQAKNLDRLTSPGSDEYSTAPSTPALSLGGDSSPRHSLLATPTYLRTVSGTKDPILRDFEPESEPEESGVDSMEADAMDASLSTNTKGEDNRADEPATTEPSSSAEMETAPEPVPEIVDGPDADGSENANTHSKVQGAEQNGSLEESGPAATEILSVVPPDHNGTASTTTATPPDICTPLAITEIQGLEDALYNQNQSLGAEDVAGEPDVVVFSQCPDFPTPQVRRSAPTTHDPTVSDPAVNPDSEANSAPNDGTELDSATPVVLLVDELKGADPTGSAGNFGESLQAQDDGGHLGQDGSDKQNSQKDGADVESEPIVRIDFAEKADAHGTEQPGKAEAPKEIDTDILFKSCAGSDIQNTSVPNSTGVSNEVSEHGSGKESNSGPRTTENEVPESLEGTGDDSVVDPAGSAAEELEAELHDKPASLESDPSKSEAEAEVADTACSDTQATKSEPSESAEPASETDAPENASVINNHSTLNNSTTETKTVPDGQVPQLHAQPHATEDTTLFSATAGPEDVPEDAEVHDIGQTVGVLDQNIGTDPESHVHVFQALGGEEEQPVFTFTRRASKLGEDFCGHEYSMGNRVGYAALCVAHDAGDKAVVIPVEVIGAQAGCGHTGDGPVTTGAGEDVSEENLGAPDEDEVLNEQTSTDDHEVLEAPAVLVVADEIPESNGSEVDSREPEQDDGIAAGDNMSVMEGLEAKIRGDLHDEQVATGIKVPAVVVIDQTTTGNEVPEKLDLAAEAGNEPVEDNQAQAEHDISEVTIESEVKDELAAVEDIEAEGPVIIVAEQTIKDSDALKRQAPEPEVSGAPQNDDQIPPDHDISEHVAFEAEATGEMPDLGPGISVKDLEVPEPCNPEPVPEKGDYPDTKHVAESPEQAESKGLNVPETAESAYIIDPAIKMGEFNPLFLNPFAPVSARSCASSVSDASDFVGPRDSVDTIRRSEDDTYLEADSSEGYQSRPQTAGYLGLGDTRRVKVGLWGGAAAGLQGDIRRYSLPLQYLLDEQPHLHQHQDSVPTASVSGSKRMGGGRRTWAKLTRGLNAADPNLDVDVEEEKEEHHLRRRKHREVKRQKHHAHPAKEEIPALSEEMSAEQAVYDGPSVVPRLMFLIAGAVALAKVVKGPAVN